MNWKRVAWLGLALWAAPFLLAVLIFGIRTDNRALFESIITVVGVWSAVAGSLIYFRKAKRSPTLGLQVGLVWAGISVLIDLPIFLGVFRMSVGEYFADIALTYLAFPAIALAAAAAPSAPLAATSGGEGPTL